MSKFERPRLVRKLTVGDIKQGFHWLHGNAYNIRDEESGDSFRVTITNIIRTDGDNYSPDRWDIFVKKPNSEEEFFWKSHVRGNVSVTEEFFLSI